MMFLKGHDGWVSCAAFSPDGKTLASASYDKTIKLWEVSSGKELHSIEAHSDAVTTIAFSPSGKLLASASYDETIKIWRVPDWRE